MKKHRIGRSDLHVAPLAFGGNVFGWTASEKESFRLLDEFTERGFNLIDTADVYAHWAGNAGISETIIGRWMKQRKNRDKVIIATKVGMDMGEGVGLSKKYVLKAAEASLRRLQTDYIDLYQSHKDDLSTPLNETLAAYAELIGQKKVRFIGASNFTPERLAESLEVSARHGFPRYECLQPHYNLCVREPFETGLAPICSREELGVLPYYALAAGFLTGKYRNAADTDQSVRGKGALKYLNEKGLRILGALDQVSASRKSTPATVAIAWLAGRETVTAPIASATSLTQLEELLAGAGMELTGAEVSLLDEASR